MTGWLLAQPLKERRDRQIVTAAAVVADVDGLSILLGVDAYSRWHHTFGHNVFAATAVTAFGAAAGRDRLKVAVLSLVAYHSHIFLDLLGSGKDWPISYFWPASAITYAFDPPFQWELVSWQNIGFTLVLLGFILNLGLRHGRTIAEVLSRRADRVIVQRIAQVFGKRST